MLDKGAAISGLVDELDLVLHHLKGKIFADCARREDVLGNDIFPVENKNQARSASLRSLSRQRAWAEKLEAVYVV